MAQPAYPAPDPSPHELSCNQLLQVLASSSQPCRVAGRLLQLSQLCAGGTDTLSRNLRHRRRGARQQLMTARQSPILPVVTAAGSHHLACRCRRSRLQLRWVAEEQSRLLDRLFHACTFGLGHLLAPGTPVPAGGHLSAPTETSPTSAAPVSRRETGAPPRHANTASPETLLLLAPQRKPSAAVKKTVKGVEAGIKTSFHGYAH